MIRRRRITGTVAALGCVLAAVAMPASGSAAGAPADRPTLTVRAVAPRVVAHKSGARVYVDLGIYLVAGAVPFEIRTTRASYRAPVVARLVVGEPDSAGNGESDDVELDQDMVDSFRGLADFLRLRVRDADGRLVADRSMDYCVPGKGVRSGPEAPPSSPYPAYAGCYYHPFTLGAVMGIEAGWGVAAFGDYGLALPLRRGRYDVSLAVAKRYRGLLDMTPDTAVQTVRLRVLKGDDDCFRTGARGCRTDRPAAGDRPVASRPRASEPRADVAPPAGTPLPDLRSLPSTGIRVRGHFLTFGATVWNAGPSTLVVDGFRRPAEDVMDSYQMFYDVDGNPAGQQRVGTMAWDTRDGHRHWHFKDFARYRLLDSDKQGVVRSKKEAFCLAATDAVDYTLPGANWEPWNTDLATACGGHGSLAVREVLDVGSGDTYQQDRPGQSFDLDGLPDGRYYISVEANPAHNLLEADLTNNVALRRLRIGTDRDGQRTVKVFDVGLVHTS